MKKWIVFLLTVALFCLCGCENKAQVEQKPPISQYKSQGTYIDLGDEKLSWEGLNALPKKRSDMTPYEARETAVAFWYYVKTALWMPDDRYEIYQDKDGDGIEELQRWVDRGNVYAGLPYVGTGTGSVYRLMDFMDEETGVVDVKAAGTYPKLFGNMCSNGCFWGWVRVMNSANYTWCANAVAQNLCLPVGPYTYNTTIRQYEEIGYGTDDICTDNGEQVMYQSYANMDIADGLVTLWENNGHIMMCTIAPHVEYDADGTINGYKSYLCVTEQGGTWDPGVSPNGIAYQYEYSKDKKFTFHKLWEQQYIPFTFGELIGTDPIEETEASFSYSGQTITKSQLFDARVTTNYAISDVYVYVYDGAGNEVLKHSIRARTPSTMELKIYRSGQTTYTWGSWDDLSKDESYTVKVEVQLGTGERPVLYNGELIMS